jgi:hypothetical protein
MFAFQPNGPIQSFTGATSAPTSVQAVTGNKTQNQQYVLTNTDSTNDCVIGWGQSDTEAKLNAASGTNVQNCYYLLARSQVVVTAASGAYFSGITASSTAVVKVQPGYGA